MSTTEKVVLVAGGSLAALAAYYWFVYLPGQTATANAGVAINNAVSQAASSGVPQVTLADLQAEIWIKPDNSCGTSLITGYNPSTGIVSQSDTNWTGLLLDPNTIQWTKKTGETQIMKVKPLANGQGLRDSSNGKVYVYNNGMKQWTSTLNALSKAFGDNNTNKLLAATKVVNVPSSFVSAIPDGTTLSGFKGSRLMY